MSETQDKKQGSSEEEQGKFNIQRLYVKDISFEAPNSPQCFTEQWEPMNELDLNTNATPIAEHTYEVVLSVTVTTKLGDNVAFLAEVQQAGIFYIEGFSEANLHAMLGSFCPNILFPYLREAVSDIVTRGGFPPLLLNPVNFDALYQQHMQQQAQASESQTAK